MSLPIEAVSTASSGLVFVNYYSANVTDAYRSAILTAEHFLESQFTNSVTLSVNFDLAPLGAGYVAQNNFSSVSVEYSRFRAALVSHATTLDDALAVAGLPAQDPSGGAGFSLPLGEAVALGLAPQTNVTNDSTTLNSSVAFTFGQDAVGAIEHELSEGALGRTASLGFADPRWSALDLYRFSASGGRDVTGGSDGVATYFGLDARHVSNLQFHNSINAQGVNDGYDLGDWDSTRGDAFGPGGPGAPGVVTATDLQLLDVLGWTPIGSGTGYAPAPDDFASSLTDTRPFGQLSVGGTASGAMERAGDRDWFVVTLQKGATYAITEVGRTGGGGTLADPFLRLHDGSGALIASNDDIIDGANPDSSISYTATATGTYYVEAGAFADGYAGTYRVGVNQTTAAPPPPVATLPPLVASALSGILRTAVGDPANLGLAANLAMQLAGGSLTPLQAVSEIVHLAGSTTGVATLSYEFFTGKAPSAAGIDFLVSPSGPNPNNLNSAYYQHFGLENRYINFAVNLGKAGEGAASFSAQYGALSLFDATRQAYASIFGASPSDTKLHALLDPTTVLNGQTLTRADYFALYGGDGANGIGTKAAMVGWLLAEAEKADVGAFALSNDAFLTDVGLHNAPFGVDIIGVYNQPAFVYHPG
jgi:hypothetical protein